MLNEIQIKRAKKAKKALENFKILPSEIKKIESFATKMNGKVTEITGYYKKGIDELGFVQVKCEMCSNNMSERENDVYLECCTFDRRCSFVHS